MRADEIVDGFRGGASDGYMSASGEVYPRGEARCMCPTCGQEMLAAEMDLLRLLDTVALPRKRMAILDALVEAYPLSVSLPAMAEAVYGHSDTKNIHSLRVLIYHLRADINPYGWLIPNAKTGRGSPGYRLKSKIKRK